MTKRDEYVHDLKAHIDRCNAQLATWEKEAAKAREGARRSYDAHLKEMHQLREKALYQLKLLEGASTAAWADLSRGADEAAKRFGAAVAEAGEHFTKKS